MIDGLYDTFEDISRENLEKLYEESKETLEQKEQSRKRINVLFKLTENIYTALKNDSCGVKRHIEDINRNCDAHKTGCTYMNASGENLEDKVIAVLEKNTKYTMPFFKKIIFVALGLFFSFAISSFRIQSELLTEVKVLVSQFSSHVELDKEKALARQARLDRLEREILR